MTKTNNETNATTETKTETKTVKTPVSYPFRSKASILAEIETSDVFMLECLQIMYARQTDHEQDTKSTLNKNRAGFMSSHAVNGSVLAVKYASGEALTGEETDKARSIVCRYGKQLASHFRQLELAGNPELAKTAAIFGV